MENFEDKLSALMGNPQLIQQIMSMAQSLGTTPEPPPEPTPAPMPDLNPAMIGKVVQLAGQTSLDHDQTTLLRALKPYLSNGRLRKLEKAMRAAKIANLAATFLEGGGGIPLSAR